MAKNLTECFFMIGWDACLKHLVTLPLDEAINETVNHVKQTIRKNRTV